ncbi:MAG: DivIVA domain-containing protein [Acidimicrobiales bacterium]
MVLRPEDIEQREFGSALRGFDKAEVRAFLRRVAGEVRYLEAEVDAARGGAPATERPSSDLELPRVDTRPAPPTLAPRIDDLPARDLPDLGAPGTRLPEPVATPPAALSGSSPEIEADRFGVLGDRIANLLRDAQETAEQVRNQANADAAQTRAEAMAASDEIRSSADDYATQTRSEAAAAADELRTSAESYSIEVRAAADTDAASMRAAAEEALANAQAEAAEIREHALADATELRTRAAAELDAARAEAGQTISQAETEAVTLRQQAIDDGVASLSSREQAVTESEAQVAAEREQALAELSDARAQVSTLLQEARAQSEFIRQESEEIIRTKVRANMEQAQRRIDMLRTTETASKDRIAAARKELESALARLDAEPVPGLPAGTEDLVLEEAQQVALGQVGHEAAAAEPAAGGDEFADANIIEAGLVESSFEAGSFEAESFESSAYEAAGYDEIDPDAVDAASAAADAFEAAAAADDGGMTAEAVIESLGEAPADTDADAPGMVDLPAPEAITPPPPPPGFGPSEHGGNFFTRSEGAIPPPPPPPGFDAPVGIDAPVFDTGSNDPGAVIDPLEGLIPDENEGAPTLEYAVEAGGDSLDAADSGSSDALADIDTPENEDALAKLVREAMQRAVDSARGNQN